MAARIVLKPRRSKYGNRVVVAGSMRFASVKEHRRWLELCALEAAGVITGLRRQVPFDLTVNGIHVCRYVADATYLVYEDGAYVVEDTKSPATRRIAAYRMKRRLMEALYGIVIRET